MALVLPISSDSEFGRRIERARDDLASLASRFPDDNWIASMKLQMEFLLSHLGGVTRFDAATLEKLNFGVMASRTLSGLDDRLEDELHAISNYLAEKTGRR